MTKGNVHLAPDGVNILTALRVNRDFMALMRAHYPSQVKNYPPKYMERVPSKDHEVSPQSGLGAG